MEQDSLDQIAPDEILLRTIPPKNVEAGTADSPSSNSFQPKLDDHGDYATSFFRYKKMPYSISEWLERSGCNLDGWAVAYIRASDATELGYTLEPKPLSESDPSHCHMYEGDFGTNQKKKKRKRLAECSTYLSQEEIESGKIEG